MPLNEAIVVKILANGSTLKSRNGLQIISFSYEDSEKEDDMVEISIADPKMELFDSDQVQEGAEWEVQWGFANKLYERRKVIVKRPRFRHGVVEISALDKGSDMKLQENWGVFKDKTFASIIQEIASKHGLKAVISPDLTQKIQFLVQGGKTDFQLLKLLESKTQDHVFKINSDKLEFIRRKLGLPPIISFAYSNGPGSRILDFDIHMKEQDNAKAGKQSTAVAVNPVSGKPEVFSADESNTPIENLGSVRPAANYKGFSSLLTGSISKLFSGGSVGFNLKETTGKAFPIPWKQDQQEMKSMVQKKRRDAILDSIEANFTIAASSQDTFLTSGDTIEITGLGGTWSGTYIIETITHDLSAGYKYNITAKRNAKGASGLDQTSALNGVTNKKKYKNPGVGSSNKTIIDSSTRNPWFSGAVNNVTGG